MRAILQELVYDAPVDGAVWPFDRRYIRPPHFHGQLELLLIRSGIATLHLGTRAERVRAGHLSWILPGVPHAMSGFSVDFDMWVVELEAAVVRSCWGAVEAGAGNGAGGAGAREPPSPFDAVALLGDRLAGRATIDVGRDEGQRLHALARQVWGADSALGVRAVLGALCELALQVTLSSVDARREVSVADLATCLLLAAPAMDRPAVASALGVSEGFVSRCFSNELGATFVEQRARARVAHFLALARGHGYGPQAHGEPNLLEAALAAGFGSYSQFHRVFTRLTGSRPCDYLDSGGHHPLQLLVAGDSDRPHGAPLRTLPPRLRHVARLDLSALI